jgi:hypothetical protein
MNRLIRKLRQTLPVGQVAQFALPRLRRAVLTGYRDCIGRSAALV